MSLRDVVVAIQNTVFGGTVTVEIEMKTPSAARRLFVDDTELVIAADGKATASVVHGTRYLFWVVFGGNGQSYSVKITSPESAKWDSGALLISGDHDVGAHEFSV
jgi:hypothetical protein